MQAVVDAHHETTGKAVPAMFCPPYCTDAIDANRLGIPTCVYGSGGTSRFDGPGIGDLRAKQGEFVLIDDMVNQAAVVMSAAMKLNDMPMAKIFASRAPLPGSIPALDQELKAASKPDGGNGSRAAAMQAKGA